jgi:hypothetical protein
VENVKPAVENVKPAVENVKPAVENVKPAVENVKPVAKPAAIQLNKRQQSLVNAGYQSPGLKNRLRGKTRKVKTV